MPPFFLCLHCGSRLSAPRSHAGAAARCPNCLRDIVLPLDPALLAPHETRPKTSERPSHFDPRWVDMERPPHDAAPGTGTPAPEPGA